MSWGSKKLSNGATYFGPLEHYEYIDAIQNPVKWLNGEWSKEKQDVFNNLYDFGAFGWYPFRDRFDQILDDRINQLYMGRYDVDYSSVVDPRKLHTTSNVRIYSNAFNFVSANVKRLYRD